MIATIDLDDEGFVDFHLMPDGSIGVTQVSPGNAPMYVGDLMSRHKASPLEVYLALADDAQDRQPPSELTEEHAWRSAQGPRDLRSSLSSGSGACTSDAGWNSYWEVLTDTYTDNTDNHEYTTSQRRNTEASPEDTDRVYALCHLSEDSPDEEQPFSISTDVGSYWFIYPTYQVEVSYYLTHFSTTTSASQYAYASADTASSNFWLSHAWHW